jgi:hypothetical protein
MDHWFLTALTGGAAGIVLPAALTFLLRHWILERLKAAISFEYQQKIEALRLEHNQLLEQIREARAEREALRSTILSSLTSTQAGILGRRLQAIEVLWKSVLELGSVVDPLIFTIDMVGYQPEKFGRALHDWLKSVNTLELSKAMRTVRERVFELRPFVGERLYALFFGLQVAYGRATLETVYSYQQGRFRKWYEDAEVRQLFKVALTDDEFQKFYSLKSQNLDWFRRTLEEKIILEISTVLSGQSTASDHLTSARQLIAAASIVNQALQRQT